MFIRLLELPADLARKIGARLRLAVSGSAPLPAEVQNYTTYDAAMMSGAPAAEAAKAVLRLLATPAAKAAFTAAGVE